MIMVKSSSMKSVYGNNFSWYSATSTPNRNSSKTANRKGGIKTSSEYKRSSGGVGTSNDFMGKVTERAEKGQLSVTIPQNTAESININNYIANII